MNPKKQREVLFLSFLLLFLLTAGMALTGIWISWKSPDIELPHLGKLVAITIVEVCAGIVLLFYKSFGLKKQPSDAASSNDDKEDSVKDCFSLFKDCLNACSSVEVNFRLHFLSYNSDEDSLSMAVQDDVYQDSHFEMGIDEGCQKDIVVCKALRKKGLVSEKLSSDHFVKYPNSPIRKKLREVMAFSISKADGSVKGVVALDSDEELEKIGITGGKLEKIFLKLCKVIENILNN